MKRFFKGIGKFFKNLFKLTGKELLGLLLDLLAIGCATPSLFINFFIVFYATSDMTPSQKGVAFVIIGLILTGAIWLIYKLRRIMLDNLKPFQKIGVRIFYKIKWFVVIGLIFLLYTFKLDMTQLYIYFGVCMLTYSLSIVFRACWLKLNKKDWEYEYKKKTYKF